MDVSLAFGHSARCDIGAACEGTCVTVRAMRSSSTAVLIAVGSRLRVAVVLIGLTIAFTGAQLRARATFELTRASIQDINAAFAGGALTSERLTQLYLARIEAYDKQGPTLNAILTLNPRALEDARALDAERRLKGSRGALHGIPVLLKANIEVGGLPASAGFYGLRHNIALQDAEITRRLRAAGCVILGLTNMSEFASGPAISSLGGQLRNPHALDRSPQGSSGGSATAVAAAFAPISIGTDTGGSVRGPAAVNGILGLRPSLGVVGRGGIIPLALSLDTAGPMATRVADIAMVLNVMAGPDPRDSTVLAAREAVDYGAALERATLRGARFGVVRAHMGVHAAADAVIESAIQLLRAEGAEVLEVTLPRFLPGVVLGSYEVVRDTEFPAQTTGTYRPSRTLHSRKPTLTSCALVSNFYRSRNDRGWPTEYRVEAHRREASTSLKDQPYLSALNEARKIVRDVLTWVIAEHKLDALISPTSPPARFITEENTIVPPGWRTFASMTGWPDLTVPVGFTTEPALPVGMSFLGPAFTEPQLLGYAAALVRALPARRLPVSTPPLTGERIDC